MLREEILGKMKQINSEIASGQLEDEDLMAKRSEFDELAAEVTRIDAIMTAERTTKHEKEVQDNELGKEFMKYLRGEDMSDRARSALACRDAKMVDRYGKKAIRAPGDAWVYFARRTTTTTADTLDDATVSSDIADFMPCGDLADVFMLPLPPAPIFDRATKIPALNGVAVPLIVQTAADPYAGVSIGKELEETEAKPVTSITDDDISISTSEYAASTIVSDLALRRAPNYESMIQMLFRSALAYQVDADIIAALLGDGGIELVTREVADEVHWRDLVNLEGALPWFWAINGEYAMHQDAMTFIKGTQIDATNVGYPIFYPNPSTQAYSQLNGHSWFLDQLEDLGDEGDVIYGDFSNIYVGVGQDIVFRRTDEGLTLRQHNSTAFFVWAHFGIGIPVGEAFSVLDDLVTTTSGGA